MNPLRLTKHSDYALRTLLYLALHPGQVIATEEIATAYRIGRTHLVKAIQTLDSLGFLEVRRGRLGGLCLAVPPQSISLGQVIRATEPDFHLVECFDRDRNTCPIVSACGLIAPLHAAIQAFLATLDQYTLADLAGPRKATKTRRLLTILHNA